MKKYCTIKVRYDYQDELVNKFLNDRESVSVSNMLEHMSIWDYGVQSEVEGRMLDELPYNNCDELNYSRDDYVLMWNSQYRYAILIRQMAESNLETA